MALILVAGSEPGAGATAVTVGLARRLALAGHVVRVERLAGDERAAGDAAVFATLEFASAVGEPVEAAALASTAHGVTLAEAPAGADAATLAGGLAASLVVVGPRDAAVPEGATLIANRVLHAAPMQLPEDRLLAAPTVGRLAQASGARVLARSVEGDAAICEHIVIGPISEDADEPHFARFPRKAVITRSEKVDVALAALRAGTRCLILTGGVEPSPYLLDYVSSTRETTLLLAPGGTVETVRDLEGAFGSTPFAGAEKIERAGELLGEALDGEAVAALIAGSPAG